MSTTEEVRRPGRPRSAAADSAILQATLELLLDTGYRGLTMEQVRARAGVGKATLYRRYGSKEELVAAAVRHLNQEIPVPDTGNVRDDILAVAGSVLAAATSVGAATFMPRMLAESAERRELRPDLDVELAVDLIGGPWVYRLLISGGKLPEVGPEGLVDLVLSGIASP